jgi:hypothetical protein
MKEVAATVPADFLCFISKKIMSDPVVAEDGETYERESIESYFAEKEKYSSPITSPATGKPMGKSILPNNRLRTQITDFLAFNPTALQSMYFRKSLYSLALKAIAENNPHDLQRLIETDRRILDSTFEGNKKLLDMVCEQGTSELLSLVLGELNKPCLPNQSSVNPHQSHFGGGGFGGGFGAAPQPNPVPSPILSPERLPDERKAQLLLMCYKNGNMKPEALSILAKAFWSQDAARKAFVVQLISSGNVELITALINGKVFEIEEELVEYQKNRALHLAVQGNKTEMVKALVFLGADIHAKNKDSQTPKRLSKHAVFHADISRWNLEKTLEPLMAAIKLREEENVQLKKDVEVLQTQLGLFVNKPTGQSSTATAMPTSGQGPDMKL